MESQPTGVSSGQEEMPTSESIPPNQSTSSEQPTPPTQQVDPHHIRIMQQQMVLLMHAFKCLRRQREREESGQDVPYYCSYHHCQEMRNLLTHVETCRSGLDCTDKNCFVCRQMILHFRHCSSMECEVCLPFRRHMISAPMLNEE